MAERIDAASAPVDMLMARAFSGQLTRREALKRALALGLSAPLVSLLLAACGTGTPTPTKSSATGAAGTAKKGGTIKAGLASDVGNLDPLRSSFLVDRQVFYNMYDSLVTIDNELKIVPSLAEKWETPRRQDLHLHPPAGCQVPRRHRLQRRGGQVQHRALPERQEHPAQERTRHDTSVEVVDPNTVKFNLKAPFAPLLANLVDRAGMMVSPKAVQAGGARFHAQAGRCRYRAVQVCRVGQGRPHHPDPNENYWRKDAAGSALPYLDKITYRPITDETVRSPT